MERPQDHTCDAYRKKFNEDMERMIQEKRSQELEVEAIASRKRAKEQVVRENRAKLVQKRKAPIPVSQLNEDEARARVQSLIIQIDALLKDPAGIREDLFEVFLSEKVRLERGEAPKPNTKLLVEKQTEEIRTSCQRELKVIKAFQSFKRDENFALPRSPARRSERSRECSRERNYDFRNERSREYPRERTRDYRNELDDRSRERSRDREHRGRRAWERHGDEVVEVGARRKPADDSVTIPERRSELRRPEPEKEGRQEPIGCAFVHQKVRGLTPERSRNQRRDRRNKSPNPYDKSWQEDAAYYATFELPHKRSSSGEREDTPPKYQRMLSTVHVVEPLVVTLPGDALMDTSSSQETVVHKRNVILDSNLQPSTSTSKAPPRREQDVRQLIEDRRQQESRREPDDDENQMIVAKRINRPGLTIRNDVPNLSVKRIIWII
ncbi:RNA-binding protein 25-like [Paramacrobiotus metropolitanus]|uniref:RNA-binding protein 25-like n=1 Tax=Paramacrobiotus metropolitanus TaxID=2943436 RepID=UPI002445B5A5|nr:RNA-binding protein 25-like [Paramacrobiotus metropolitanus]